MYLAVIVIVVVLLCWVSLVCRCCCAKKVDNTTRQPESNRLGLLLIMIAISVAWKKCGELRSKPADRVHPNQTADVWNISGRVNHQEGAVTSEPQRWPTHDHHVSIDSFVMPENLQGHRKDRIPPPPYCEVDLPTYEQATGVPKPKNDLPAVHIAPSSSRNFDEPRS